MKIFKFLNSKNKKVLFNVFSKLTFVFFVKIISFITIPIISKALGPSNFGTYNYIITIASYGFLLSNWGFLAKGIRDVARNPKNGYMVVANIVPSRVFLWILGGVIVLILSNFLYDSYSFITLIFLALVANLGLAINLDFYYYGIKNTFLPSLSQFLGQVIFLLLVFVLIKSEDDLFLLLILNVLARLTESIVLLIDFLRKNNLKLEFSFNNTFLILKQNFFLGLGAKSSFFQNSFPILIIPYFLNNFQLGVFSAAFKIYIIVGLLLQSLNLVFSPWIVESLKDKIKMKSMFVKLVALYFFLGMMVSMFLYFFSEMIVLELFGEEYKGSIPLLKLFAVFLVPLYSLYMVLINYLNNFENDKVFFFGSIINVIISLISIIFFIQIYGLNGVVFGLSLSILVTIIYYYNKLQLNKY